MNKKIKKVAVLFTCIFIIIFIAHKITNKYTNDGYINAPGLKINVTSKWQVYSAKDPIIVNSINKSVSIAFAVHKPKKDINQYKLYLQKNNMPYEVHNFTIGCKTVEGIMEKSKNGDFESVYISYSPQLTIHANIVVDNKLENSRAMLRDFLSKNITCN